MLASSKKLKIAMVLDDGLDKPDGVQQYILAIGSWLVSRGHQVDYLVGQTSRTDLPNVYSLSKNIRVSSNGNSMTIPIPTSKTKLKKFLLDHHYDVLHIQTPFSPFMGGKLINLATDDQAVVGTFHILPNSKFIYHGNRALGVWSRKSLKRFDKMLSVSTAAQEFALKTFNIESTVLPNVVDYPRFHNALPLTKSGESINILFLGRLVPRKGCMLLLLAINALVVGSPEISRKINVKICGTGSQKTKLEAYVKNNQLEAIVEFVGFVSEELKPRYYATADIAVFPSSGGESFGIVLLEAMASGRSVVLAGDNPGYRSVLGVQPELLFDPTSSQDLANRILYYLSDNKRIESIASWCGNFSKQFDVPIVGNQLIDIYLQALRNRQNQ